MTFYLEFFQTPLDPIGFRLLFCCWDFFISIVTEICHISNCTEYFLQVFNFAFPLTQSLFRHRIPPHRALGPPVLTCISSFSSGIMELYPCRFPVRDLYTPSQSHGSFFQESQFKESDFVQHFQLPLDYFCSSGELQPRCDPWAAPSSFPTGFQP